MLRTKALLLATLAGAAFVATVTPVAPAASEAADGQGALCSAEFRIVHANWDFCWQQEDRRVQGLEINDAKYQGARVLWKMGIPFSITRYQVPGGLGIGPYKDALGNAGAGGVPGYGLGATPIQPAACPRFTGGEGTLINGGKTCVEKTGGINAKVAIWARWNVYNYKFINGYIFHADGTIEPKILFGGYLIDGCGSTGSHCRDHFHHAYWRFDFDVVDAGTDRVQQFARSEHGVGVSGIGGAVADGLWTTVAAETPLVRDYAAFGKFRVVDETNRNPNNIPRGYELLPGGQGPGDGVSSADAWVFAWRSDSLELGYEVPTNPYTDSAVARYINGGEVAPGDVVLWYVEHSFHETRDEDKPTMIYHANGPTLKPRNFSPSNTIEFSGG